MRRAFYVLLMLAVLCIPSCQAAALEVSYQPFIPLKVSINSRGEIELGISHSFPTPVGIFSIGADTTIYELRNRFPQRILVIRIDDKAHIYTLQDGIEFQITLDERNRLYQKVNLVYEADGDIVLELATIAVSIPGRTGTPTLHYIDEHEETASGRLMLHKNVYFSDAEGDALAIVYSLESVVPSISGVYVENDKIDIPANLQKAGTYQSIIWDCGSNQREYVVTLRAHLLDGAGNKSPEFYVIFDCH